MPFLIVDRGGLQPERTALSWQRTAISASVAVVPLMFVDVRLGHWLLAGVCGVAGLVITGFAAALRRRVAHLSVDRLDLSPQPDIVRIAAATVILAVLGVITAVALALES